MEMVIYLVIWEVTMAHRISTTLLDAPPPLIMKLLFLVETVRQLILPITHRCALVIV